MYISNTIMSNTIMSKDTLFNFINNREYIRTLTLQDLENFEDEFIELRELLRDEDCNIIIVIIIDRVDQIYNLYAEYGLKYYHFLIDDEYYIATLHVDGSIDNNAICMLNAQLCGEIGPIHTSIGSKPTPNSQLHSQYVWASNNEWLEWCSSEQKDWVTKAPLHLLIVKLNTDCLYIHTEEDFLKFYEMYKAEGYGNIDWPRVFTKYKSISIMKYFSVFRMSIDFYYGWDVASFMIYYPLDNNGNPNVQIIDLNPRQRIALLTVMGLESIDNISDDEESDGRSDEGNCDGERNNNSEEYSGIKCIECSFI